MKFFNKLTTKVSMVLAAMAFAANADAQELVTVDKVTIAPGETKEIAVNYTYEAKRLSCEAHITLPEGLSYVPYNIYNEDDEEYVQSYAKKGTACKSGHALSEKLTDAQHLSVVVASMQQQEFKTAGGSLFTFQVKADENIADNTQIDMKVMLSLDQDYRIIAVPVEKDQTTGISSVEAANGASEVFDAAGVRKSSASKGLNIIRTAGKTIKVVK